ncbi:MAG: gamma-glutamyl-gamma-aminobutyrate hydrolase family protein [Moritella sp.]|uniref:gamma-glutamyl-gamma-aminobutyrate hydrolase family protein n=1 Tax=Moritella sp. TaxID=78556 RepID=UPI0029A92BEC|nr:gamma-glutamyl-gamma-aminobutyrate hydrolase family protein [Moritella sp.]MDX2320277.1 gamma-glutamyl-gamma-aminobutyrate hydrolase family protein [Moritella sp.]
MSDKNKPHKKPLVGIPCCSNKLGIHDFQMVADKYINAAITCSEVVPILIPAWESSALALLSHLDGLYLTGSYSNMEPHNYGEDELAEPMPRDSRRDQINLALIRAALELKMPVLGVCRGFQEMNVALGGSLHQQLFTLPEMIEHREVKGAAIDAQYDIAHAIDLIPSGLLADLMRADVNPSELQQQINSLHGQGVARLASSLKIEATAPDGLIEAFSLASNASYYLGLQWHPEWQVERNPFYTQIYRSFGVACAKFQSQKTN